MTTAKNILLAISCAALSACGGSGGGSSSGTVFEGVLIQGETVEHSAKQVYAQVAHGAGEFLENIEICAVGECSKTDANGRWGFASEATFAGGDIAFTIKGHGIDTTTIITVPSGADNVEIEFENHGTEGVHAHSVVVDGVETAQHSE